MSRGGAPQVAPGGYSAGPWKERKIGGGVRRPSGTRDIVGRDDRVIATIWDIVDGGFAPPEVAEANQRVIEGATRLLETAEWLIAAVEAQRWGEVGRAMESLQVAVDLCGPPRPQAAAPTETETKEAT